MRIVLAVLLAGLVLPSVFANVIVTEIMYNPDPVSDTDAEWIEVYNAGDVAMDVSTWTLNGANFDDMVLQSQQHAIIARELVDGSDEDLDSFESMYGNHDGVWNDGFLAVQGSMSLIDEGSVVLANAEGVQEYLNYSSAWGGKGNGHSLYRKSLDLPNTPENWAEHPVRDGTPGRGEESTLHVSFFVESPTIVVLNKTLTDDLPQQGFQVIPNPGRDRELQLVLEVESASNPSGIVTFEDAVIPFNVSITTLSATISIPSSLAAGNHSLAVHIVDGTKEYDEVILFEVMPLLALETSTSALDFGAVLQNESSSEKVVTVKNTGNTMLNAALSASNLTNGDHALTPSVLSVTTENGTTPLDYSTNLALNLQPGTVKDVSFIASIPEHAAVGSYVGAISMVGKP